MQEAVHQTSNAAIFSQTDLRLGDALTLPLTNSITMSGFNGEKQNNSHLEGLESFTSSGILYEQCPNCQRKFFEGKLPMHQKSCKPGKILKKRPTRQGEVKNEAKISPSNIKAEANLTTSQYPEQIYTPRLPVHEEEENEFLKPSALPIQVVFVTNSPPNFKDVSYQNQETSSQTPGQTELNQCEGCGRKFMSQRIEKHMTVCNKSKKLRPVFNSKQQRLDEQAAAIKATTIAAMPIEKSTRQSRDKPKSAVPLKKADKPKWKIDHQNFINSIRAMKQQTTDLAEGKPFVNKPLESPDYVQCKFCLRKFAPNVASVHIPKCEKILNRPRPPTDKTTTKMKQTFNHHTEKLKQVVVNKVSSIKCLQDAHPHHAIPIKTNNFQSASQLERNMTLKEPVKLVKNANLFQKKITTQYNKLDSTGEVNTFAGFVRKYEDAVTRASHFSNVECPHCQRKFNDKASQRHIPICAELNRFKKPEKQSAKAAKRGNSVKVQTQTDQFCTHCGFKFSFGHKYCSNCGKKRQ